MPRVSGPDTQALHTARRQLWSQNPVVNSVHLFWRGTSGHAYVHTSYPLVYCPPMPEASALFVRRSADGHRAVLAAECVEWPVPSLNLAYVRQRGAELEANEVHLHFAAGGRSGRWSAAIDLRIAHCGIEPVGR